jgi:hypothetical protein
MFPENPQMKVELFVLLRVNLSFDHSSLDLRVYWYIHSIEMKQVRHRHLIFTQSIFRVHNYNVSMSKYKQCHIFVNKSGWVFVAVHLITFNYVATQFRPSLGNSTSHDIGKQFISQAIVHHVVYYFTPENIR